MLHDPYPNLSYCYNLVQLANLISYVYDLKVSVETHTDAEGKLIFLDNNGQERLSERIDLSHSEEHRVTRAVDMLIRRYPTEILYTMKEAQAGAEHSHDFRLAVARLKIGLGSHILGLATNHQDYTAAGYHLDSAQHHSLLQASYNLKWHGLPQALHLPFQNASLATVFFDVVDSYQGNEPGHITLAANLLSGGLDIIRNCTRVTSIAEMFWAQSNPARVSQTSPVIS